jgi:hypothetical protein
MIAVEPGDLFDEIDLPLQINPVSWDGHPEGVRAFRFDLQMKIL